MPEASSDNLIGHRTKYDTLMAHYSPDEALMHYVGGSDPIWTGYAEIEAIRRFHPLAGAAVIDIGCGIGRLTSHMLHEQIASYVGIDIIPEVMKHAEDMASGDPRFRFAIGAECKIPAGDQSADVVMAFSVITHLKDEEGYEYIEEAKRVLRVGGVALFSFMDFSLPTHRGDFFRHAKVHRRGHGDLLKFTTPEILRYMAQGAGFDKVEFVGGMTPIPTSGQASPLVPAGQVPATFITGQSVCVMLA